VAASSEASKPRDQRVLDRRAELLEATRRVVLKRGLSNTRVADVADAVNVSGGLIHYHFATKDQLLSEMLRAAADHDISRIRHIAASKVGVVQRLDRVMRAFAPSAQTDSTWVLWVDAWGAALRDPALQAISEELDAAWDKVLENLIREGALSGEFTCHDPAGAATRISALLDGLGLRLTLQRTSLTRRQMLAHARHAAANELGISAEQFAARG
jgi:AcrR family transcriptional regulator